MVVHGFGETYFYDVGDVLEMFERVGRELVIAGVEEMTYVGLNDWVRRRLRDGTVWEVKGIDLRSTHGVQETS